MNMSDKLYNILKAIAQYVLPALATLYFAVASIWSLPYATEVVGTITAIDAFIGALIGVSSAQYYKKLQDQLSKQEEPKQTNVVNNSNE